MTRDFAQVEIDWASRSSFPASILEKSRMSLMTVSSESADEFHRCPGTRAALGSARFRASVGHADHAVHRRADLVAHIGQEFALGPAGRLCFLLGLAQRNLDSLQILKLLH